MIRPLPPWYSDNLRSAKREKRKSERKWNKSRLEVDRQIFQENCKNYRHMLNNAKTEYHSNKISQCESGQLFHIVASMTGKSSSRRIFPTGSDQDIADRFGNFFVSKISDIRSRLVQIKPPHTNANNNDELCQSVLRTFNQTSENAVRRFIMKTSSKSCSLDPIPTSLLKNGIDILLPTMTNIVADFPRVSFKFRS